MRGEGVFQTGFVLHALVVELGAVHDTVVEVVLLCEVVHVVGTSFFIGLSGLGKEEGDTGQLALTGLFVEQLAGTFIQNLADVHLAGIQRTGVGTCAHFVQVLRSQVGLTQPSIGFGTQQIGFCQTEHIPVRPAATPPTGFLVGNVRLVVRPAAPGTDGVRRKDSAVIGIQADVLAQPTLVLHVRIVVLQVTDVHPVTFLVAVVRIVQCPNAVLVVPSGAECIQTTTVFHQIGILLLVVVGKAILAGRGFQLVGSRVPRNNLALDFQTGSRTHVTTGIVTVDTDIEHFFIFGQRFVARLMQVPYYIFFRQIFVHTETFGHQMVNAIANHLTGGNHSIIKLTQRQVYLRQQMVSGSLSHLTDIHIVGEERSVGIQIVFQVTQDGFTLGGVEVVARSQHLVYNKGHIAILMNQAVVTESAVEGGKPQHFVLLPLIHVYILRTVEDGVGILDALVQVVPVVINLRSVARQIGRRGNLACQVHRSIRSIGTSVHAHLGEEILRQDIGVGRTCRGIEIEVTCITVQHVGTSLQSLVGVERIFGGEEREWLRVQPVGTAGGSEHHPQHAGIS